MENISHIEKKKSKDLLNFSKAGNNFIPDSLNNNQLEIQENQFKNNEMSLSLIDNIVEDLFTEKESLKLKKIEIKNPEKNSENSFIRKEKEKEFTRDLKLIHLSKEKVEKKDHIFETDFPGDDLDQEIKINANLLMNHKNNNINMNNIYKKELQIQNINIRQSKNPEKFFELNSEKPPLMNIVEDYNQIKGEKILLKDNFKNKENEENDKDKVGDINSKMNLKENENKNSNNDNDIEKEINESLPEFMRKKNSLDKNPQNNTISLVRIFNILKKILKKLKLKKLKFKKF